MPSASRLGDTGAGHGCFPPSNAIAGSPDVSINGKPALRVGDALAAHGCKDCPPHGRAVAAGSASVSINGKPAARIGDSIDCGGAMAAGSGNVNIGDLSWDGQASLPVKAALRMRVGAVPGQSGPVYTQEPYKLYVGGAMVQQGETDEEGRIDYEYTPPWTEPLVVETAFGRYEYQPQAIAPADTAAGSQSRLDALGFYATDGDEAPINQTSNDAKRYFQGAIGNPDDSDDDIVTQAIKPLIP